MHAHIHSKGPWNTPRMMSSGQQPIGCPMTPNLIADSDISSDCSWSSIKGSSLSQGCATNLGMFRV